LAVDVQLFFLFSPWLVLLFHRSGPLARKVTLFLWISSVIVTAVLTYTQEWSINTFDGAAVALFDVEGYAKPHVRAQSYLAGIFVAMWPSIESGKHHEPRPKKKLESIAGNDSFLMAGSLSCLFILSVVTVTGAYTRRACTFEELPADDDCGSMWSASATFFYTAFSRAIWSICISVLIHLSLQRQNKGFLTTTVKNILSWRIWTPLANISYGAYLIHPIVIFVWKLGGHEKISFSLFSFLMDFCSITVVTFLFSCGTTILVEFPFGNLLTQHTRRAR
jgi:peptidoglycan/LPS O-acetylase OafA/YrhL